MNRPTHVYIVASPRPRSGKTLLARALTEFFRADGRPVGAFDLDTMDATLTGFLPELAVRADIGETRGQVALFDALIINDETPKVLDVGAHCYEAFFNVVEQIDFAIEAPRHSVDPIILFCANAEPQSAKAFARLHARFPDATLVPVYNDGIVRGFSLRNDFPPTSATALPLRLPAMSPSLRAIIEAKPFSFTEFRRHAPADISELLANELTSWLRRVYLQIREMELRLLLSSLRGSLRERPERQPFDSPPPH